MEQHTRETSGLVAGRKIRLLLQLGLRKHPALPEVPLVLDLARDADQRLLFETIMQMKELAGLTSSRPRARRSRAAAARAFMKTMSDADFVNEMTKAGISIDPVSGEEMQKMLAQAPTLCHRRWRSARAPRSPTRVRAPRFPSRLKPLRTSSRQVRGGERLHRHQLLRPRDGERADRPSARRTATAMARLLSGRNCDVLRSAKPAARVAARLASSARGVTP